MQHVGGPLRLVPFDEVTAFVPPLSSPDFNVVFSSSPYQRGGWTFRALHAELGEELFFELMRSFFERFQNSTATTADFIALAEEISAQELDDFFDAWLLGTTPPANPESAGE